MASRKQQNHRVDISEQLSPPDSSTGLKEAGGGRGLLPILGIFIMLLLGAAAVLFLLPADKPGGPPSASQPVIKPQTAVEKSVVVLPDAESDEAMAAREEAMALKIDAESQNISEWGDDMYQVISAALTKADELFANQDYVTAAERYRQSTNDLHALLDSKTERFKNAYEAGQRALSDEQPEQAANHFRIALLIDPASNKAQSGIERSEQLAVVISLYEDALALEKTGALKEAAGELDKILNLDGSYAPALHARERIQAQINADIFQKQMDAVLAAIDIQDFSSARDSLRSLRKLGINREQIDQAEKLLTEHEHRVFVDRQKKTADGHRKAEQWQQALDTYNGILSVAPDVLFAVAGREEAVKRSKLDSSLGDAISKPRRLQDEKQRDMAAQLLAYAKQITPRGAHLQSQINALETLLKEAETPVNVTLESDNQTDIVIYHIGRIGIFFSKNITLKPGTYTIVGSKVGYRDVRKIVTVGADGSDYRFVIRCEEPI